MTRDLDIDPAAHERLLQFLNDAETPADLATPPGPVRTRHPEHHDEPRLGDELAEDLEQGQRRNREIGEPVFEAPRPLFEEEVAARILELRDELSPLYGFTNLEDLLDRIDIDLDPVLIPFGRARFGEWSKKYATPVPVAHAALVHTPGDDHHGRVLFIEIAHNTKKWTTPLWHPEEGTASAGFETISPPGDNLYCSGHSFLTDGRLLAVGGGGQLNEPPTVDDHGWIFDPDGKSWEPTRDKRQPKGQRSRTFMNYDRWYPTLVTLGDDGGRVLIVDGGEPKMEIYDEKSGTFSKVNDPVGGPAGASDYPFSGDYPNLLPLPNGDIAFTRAYRSGGAGAASVFSFTSGSRGKWSKLSGGAAGTDREGGMSALLLGQQPADPDRLMVVGGGHTGTTQGSVAVIDVPPSGSSWRTHRFPDGTHRHHPNVVLLPDGSVFIAGGTNNASDPCWIFRPWSATPWWEMRDMNYVRNNHHAVSLLLPSGKVMITGDQSRTIEVFSPPYLFDALGNWADRPEIASAPEPYDGESVLHGHTFDVGTPDAADIDRVVMVRPMAVTHKCDTEQRVIPCSFTQSKSDELQVTAPDTRVYPYGSPRSHSHQTAPRGVYMLFLIDNAGTPSPAQFVHLR